MNTGLTKKGTPRKRKPKEPRVYFSDQTEKAIIKYVLLTDQSERDALYKNEIEYAFYKLAENIIHTFKFYYTDNDSIEELKHEVITFLLEKMHLYNVEKGKAYSYFGTIAKRYLILYNEKNYQKLQNKADLEEVNDEENEALQDIPDISPDLSRFIGLFIQYMDIYLVKLFPKKQDAHIANTILELFRKRDSLTIFNKKALYIYIREMTDSSTPHITKIIKKLDTIRLRLFNEYYETDTITI